jgi:DNA-directed RNA polymerase specialized sigma24 family protein
VQRSTALGLLSETHAQALELAEQGLDAEEVADQLHLDPSAVEPLLRVARAKLAALEALEEPPASSGSERATNLDGDLRCD